LECWLEEETYNTIRLNPQSPFKSRVTLNHSMLSPSTQIKNLICWVVEALSQSITHLSKSSSLIVVRMPQRGSDRFVMKNLISHLRLLKITGKRRGLWVRTYSIKVRVSFFRKITNLPSIYSRKPWNLTPKTLMRNFSELLVS
jgi:hypothetical protein